MTTIELLRLKHIEEAPTKKPSEIHWVTVSEDSEIYREVMKKEFAKMNRVEKHIRIRMLWAKVRHHVLLRYDSKLQQILGYPEIDVNESYFRQVEFNDQDDDPLFKSRFLVFGASSNMQLWKFFISICCTVSALNAPYVLCFHKWDENLEYN